MFSTRKKKQQKRRLLIQLDDFYSELNMDNAVSSERQFVVVNNALADRNFTVNNIESLAVANENAADNQRLEKNLTEKITTEMSNVIEKSRR